MPTANIRITSASSVSTVMPKTARPRPLAKVFARSKYGEATVMRRLPIGILSAVNKLLMRRLAEVEAGDPDVWESR